MTFKELMEEWHCCVYELGGRVLKGRVEKKCACCNVIIPKGSPATTVKMAIGTDFFPWYICDKCIEKPDYENFISGDFNRF